MSEKNNKIKRTFEGLVVSDKNDKTIIVRVDRVKMHSKYHRLYTVSRRYKVHDEKNEYKVGDKVLILECRPLSKDKHWRVIGRIGKVKVAEEVVDEKLREIERDDEILRFERDRIKGAEDESSSNNSNNL